MLVMDWEAPKDDPPMIRKMKKIETIAKSLREKAKALPVKKRKALLAEEMKNRDFDPYFFRCLIGCDLEMICKESINTVERLLASQPSDYGTAWRDSLEKALGFWGLFLGMTWSEYHKLLGK